MESWPDRFKEFFRKVDSTLAQVFKANEVIEVWLQGEFYRHFKTTDNNFEVNYSLPNSRKKHDLYSKLPTEMVAEIKVYGYKGFQPKNLDGSSVKKYSDNKSERIFLDKAGIEGLIEMGEGTYLSDVRRLHNITQPIEKYMILVLKKDSEPDDFGKVIQKVQVSDIECNFDEQHEFFVRISKI